jgi:hypothetical protein
MPLLARKASVLRGERALRLMPSGTLGFESRKI